METNVLVSVVVVTNVLGHATCVTLICTSSFSRYCYECAVCKHGKIKPKQPNLDQDLIVNR